MSPKQAVAITAVAFLAAVTGHVLSTIIPRELVVQPPRDPLAALAELHAEERNHGTRLLCRAYREWERAAADQSPGMRRLCENLGE